MGGIPERSVLLASGEPVPRRKKQNSRLVADDYIDVAEVAVVKVLGQVVQGFPVLSEAVHTCKEELFFLNSLTGRESPPICLPAENFTRCDSAG